MMKIKTAVALLVVSGLAINGFKEPMNAQKVESSLNKGVQMQSIQLATKSKAALKLDKNLGTSLIKGKIPGLGVQLGMGESQVKKIYGKEVNKFYDLGGEFYEYEKLDDVYFCYSYGKDESILSTVYIQTPTIQKLSAGQVKKILGSKGKTVYDGEVNSKSI